MIRIGLILAAGASSVSGAAIGQTSAPALESAQITAPRLSTGLAGDHRDTATLTLTAN